jgi:hypothetical protein
MKHRPDLENIEDSNDRRTDDTFEGFQHHDVIYLQTGGEGYEDWENFEYEGVTWCQDQINDHDAKYLLATPEREVAEDLGKALQNLLLGCAIADSLGELSEHVDGSLMDAAQTAIDKMLMLMKGIKDE